MLDVFQKDFLCNHCFANCNFFLKKTLNYRVASLQQTLIIKYSCWIFWPPIPSTPSLLIKISGELAQFQTNFCTEGITIFIINFLLFQLLFLTTFSHFFFKIIIIFICLCINLYFKYMKYGLFCEGWQGLDVTDRNIFLKLSCVFSLWIVSFHRQRCIFSISINN